MLTAAHRYETGVTIENTAARGPWSVGESSLGSRSGHCHRLKMLGLSWDANTNVYTGGRTFGSAAELVTSPYVSIFFYFAPPLQVLPASGFPPPTRLSTRFPPSNFPTEIQGFRGAAGRPAPWQGDTDVVWQKGDDLWRPACLLTACCSV